MWVDTRITLSSKAKKGSNVIGVYKKRNLRGNSIPIACFVLYLKILNTLKNNICMTKWHKNFSRPSGF